MTLEYVEFQERVNQGYRPTYDELRLMSTFKKRYLRKVITEEDVQVTAYLQKINSNIRSTQRKVRKEINQI